LLVEYRGERLVYTGDIKLRAPLCGTVTEIVQCDRLIIESTFGLPIYRFLARDEARSRIVNFTRECLADGVIPVIIGHALGRGQEIAHVLWDAGIPTAIHGSIARYIPWYERAAAVVEPHAGQAHVIEPLFCGSEVVRVFELFDGRIVEGPHPLLGEGERRNEKDAANSECWFVDHDVLWCPGWDLNPHSPYGKRDFKAFPSSYSVGPGGPVLPLPGTEKPGGASRFGFRTGKRLHGISLKRVIGDVRHDFHGTLFLREMGWAGPVQVSCDNTPRSHLQPVSAVLNAKVCSLIHELQETLSAATIALEISSRNAQVVALQKAGIGGVPAST
jgi:hypothetical protein